MTTRRSSETQNPLEASILSNDLDGVKLHTKRWLAIDKPFESGLHPLALAIQEGHYEIIKYLLEKGARTHPCDEAGFTALGRFIDSGSTDERVWKLIMGHDHFLRQHAWLDLVPMCKKIFLQEIEKYAKKFEAAELMSLLYFVSTDRFCIDEF